MLGLFLVGYAACAGLFYWVAVRTSEAVPELKSAQDLAPVEVIELYSFESRRAA